MPISMVQKAIFIFLTFGNAEKAYLYQGELSEVFEDDRATRGFNFETIAVNEALNQGKTQCEHHALGAKPQTNSILWMKFVDKLI